jgi:glycosyltransferase involved in cell wall biosynthesis
LQKAKVFRSYLKILLVTFPSAHEGFGNAFLEAIYFKKPILVNRYATFVTDIEPKGFDVVAIDGHLTRETIQMAREILESPHRSREMVHNNYEIARQNYSYRSLKKQLNNVLEKLSQYKSAPVYNRYPAPSQYACNFR